MFNGCSQLSAASLCLTHSRNPAESSGAGLFPLQTYSETALLSWICCMQLPWELLPVLHPCCVTGCVCQGRGASVAGSGPWQCQGMRGGQALPCPWCLAVPGVPHSVNGRELIHAGHGCRLVKDAPDRAMSLQGSSHVTAGLQPQLHQIPPSSGRGPSSSSAPAP